MTRTVPRIWERCLALKAALLHCMQGCTLNVPNTLFTASRHANNTPVRSHCRRSLGSQEGADGHVSSVLVIRRQRADAPVQAMQRPRNVAAMRCAGDGALCGLQDGSQRVLRLCSLGGLAAVAPCLVVLLISSICLHLCRSAHEIGFRASSSLLWICLTPLICAALRTAWYAACRPCVLFRHLRTCAHHPVTLLCSGDLGRLRSRRQELTGPRALAVHRSRAGQGLLAQLQKPGGSYQRRP